MKGDGPRRKRIENEHHDRTQPGEGAKLQVITKAGDNDNGQAHDAAIYGQELSFDPADAAREFHSPIRLDHENGIKEDVAETIDRISDPPSFIWTGDRIERDEITCETQQRQGDTNAQPRK